jgi:hypothetical protein
MVLAIGAVICLQSGRFLYDRAVWAKHDVGKYVQPELIHYFNFPDPRLLLGFFPALCEEIIFRGLLQTAFVRRYGIYRGLFLIGIVWSAFHFVTDFSFRTISPSQALLLLATRFGTCLALSYVFGWLVLQSSSIWPSGIAHTLYNVSIAVGTEVYFPGRDIFRILLWAMIALALFHYWPPEDSQISNAPVAMPSPETVSTLGLGVGITVIRCLKFFI